MVSSRQLDAAWQPALIMLALGAALGLFQLPLIIWVQSSVRWAERGTATASILFCRLVGQCVGAAVFGAVANATLATRLDEAPPDLRTGLPDDLDGVSRALEHPATLTDQAADYLRRAVDTAVDHVYVGSAGAAVLALLALLFLAPRRTATGPDGKLGAAGAAGAGGTEGRDGTEGADEQAQTAG